MMMAAKENEEELHLQDAKFEVHPFEELEVIRNMSVPAQKGVDYTLKEVPPLNVHRPLPPTSSPRDLVINRLINLVETGTRELKGYDDHIASIRSFYEACLEKEIARIEEAGLRPEKRIKVAEAPM